MTKRYLLTIASAVLLLAACELQSIPSPPTPTAPPTEIVAENTPTPSPTMTASPLPILATETPTGTPEPPTTTPTLTETPNPFATYIIQQNDTLIYIVQLFGHRDLAVIDEVIRINANIRGRDSLPGAGSSITIPLPTATNTPEGFALTASAQPNVPQIRLPVDTEIIQVDVQEGITILGIAQQYNTTLPIMATLNPQLGFFNCDFSNPSGGPDCTVILGPDDRVNVPALTPTPTLSPTFSGNETATPTPTYMPPMTFFPQPDAVVSPVSFSLQWLSVGILNENETYLVEVQDTVSGAQHIDVTRSTSYRLPDSLIPADGQPHVMRWRVSVAAPNAQGAYRFISEGVWRTFTWQSR